MCVADVRRSTADVRNPVLTAVPSPYFSPLHPPLASPWQRPGAAGRRYYHKPILPNPWRDAVNCDGSGSCRIYRNTAATAEANSLYDAASVAQKGKDVDGALRFYHAAAALQPSHLQAVTNLAYLYDRLQQPTHARRWFQQLVRLFPIHTGARFRLAEMLEAEGDINGALAHYDAVAATEVGNADPLLRAANTCWKADRLTASKQ